MPAAAENRPHLPRLSPIDGYGKSGFRFAGMSHRGSLLCLPSGIWAWSVARPEDVTEQSLRPVFDAASDIGLFLIGSGRDRWVMPAALQMRFHSEKISVEIMRTGSAVSTFNILLGEGRRVAAGLIAVE
jgi:uncharacterized protein